MILALALKSLDELVAEHGPMRTVIHHARHETDVLREQHKVYEFAVLGAAALRESIVIGADRRPSLTIRCVEYVDPVTRTTRYAVDYWSLNGYRITDHEVRAVAETAYEETVRAEFARPSKGLRLSPARFLGGLAHFYDETDVL